MIIRSLMTVFIAGLLASGLSAQDEEFDREFDAGVAAARLLDGSEKVARIDALVDYLAASHDNATEVARDAVAVVGSTRIRALQEEGATLMTRAGLVRVQLNRLRRELKSADADASALLDKLVEMKTTSSSIVTDADALVTRSKSVTPAEIAAAQQAEMAKREASLKEQQAAAAAAQQADQERAAQEQAALQAALAETNPEYLNVPSENFWKDQYNADKPQVAEITTNVGTMVLEFWPEVAPGHVKNFVDLAKKGFYDGVIFHRVIKGFMIQGGCPDGNGMGGPGYKIAAEFNDRPHVRGVLSMARTNDPNSAGSQFFICHDRAASLDNLYTGFGKLVKGYDVLDTIATAERDRNDKPLEAKTMLKVTIRDRTDADVAEDR